MEYTDYQKEMENLDKELKTLKEEYYQKRDELTMLSHKIDTLERKKLFSGDIAKSIIQRRGDSCNVSKDN